MRINLERCPAEIAREPEIEAAFADYLSTVALGMPLDGGGVYGLDNWTHEALLAIKFEEPYIRAAIAKAEAR